MNLIADIGNSCVKLALIKHGEVLAECCGERLERSMLEALLAGRCAERAIVSSSRGAVESELALIRPYAIEVLLFTPQTPVPIRSSYLTPETLGRDRLAAAVGAVVIYPQRNVLIVDFGTAVTIDLVTADGVYRGGVISAGMKTRFRALHDYTAALPLCEAGDCEKLQGLTTEEAIVCGVMNSLTFEIEGYIARMNAQFDELTVIFTGGDAKNFVKRIKNTIFANCNLVFCGLNRILEYNAREEYLD